MANHNSKTTRECRVSRPRASPSGLGKPLVAPSDGLSRNALADLRNQKLGFVFQGFNLLARTSALQNVELPLQYYRTSRRRDPKALATAALGRVGLGDRLDHHPSQLSGGQQQRVAIARALVTEPTLLLADEPTGNLDSHTAIEVMVLFQALNTQGITLVLVTHELDIAQYATRIIDVKDGRIRRDAPVAVPRSAADDLVTTDAESPDSLLDTPMAGAASAARPDVFS
jgi:putative ABC transport system ATP-binding protein